MSLPGSFKAKKKNGTIYYRSSITYKNKHISLGSFPTEIEAHLAYVEASNLISHENININDFSRKSVLAFEKWVILLNYRDNKIYFNTPIYVRPKFFYYYLSPKIRFTFDIDDLFFYSSRKISQRGGHLFVADYGMQLTINSRYGIKSYAVLDKDYRFVNGDIYDYRYENIDIINPYHGVSLNLKRKEKKYCAKLHLQGNYSIGYYETALEAAIAYNKAIDIVKRNGCTKNFILNEMDISPSVYASIYSNLKISSSIINYNAKMGL
ncbi:MAG: hypothetical protein IKW30_09785 [Lachnospiraceae bacterium]|nr:hypothetical protein [Lachnospiraceae bacterium]